MNESPFLPGLVRRIGRYLLVGMAGIALASSITGCEYFPESTFKLANESRLPKWFVLAPGLARADVSIEMSYYDKPWGSTAAFVLQDGTNKILRKANGKVACGEAFRLKNPPGGFDAGYPVYEPITVDGMTEMIEHRKMEPVFYITDDPAVWKEYAAIGCR
jgi:hypothetical protein